MGASPVEAVLLRAFAAAGFPGGVFLWAFSLSSSPSDWALEPELDSESDDESKTIGISATEPTTDLVTLLFPYVPPIRFRCVPLPLWTACFEPCAAFLLDDICTRRPR